MRSLEHPPLAAVLFAVALSCSGFASGPVVAGSAESTEATLEPTVPEAHPDPCRNVWVYSNGSYHDGSLRYCKGSDPAPNGVVKGWVGDGLWPQENPDFVSCRQGASLELVVPDTPARPVRTWVYAWKEGMTHEDHPEELQHTEHPAGLRTVWPCTMAPGRYLLNVFIAWPNVATERSFGLEIK